ncbi:ran GTPase activating protein [Calliopsis andreniformis]|uniref:ran GTPase activating protein n=1 Tax=Calliopsis andreniformis TaxID=337506 RepID=UPI003FCCCF9C
MTAFNLNELEAQLKDVTQDSAGTGVSFANKSLKLNSEEDALEVVKAIRACTNLEYLDLEGNTLGPLAAKAVAQALEERGASLKRALWKDMFTGRLKTEIPKALEYLCTGLCTAGTRLTELDLSDNAFGPVGVQGLAAFLTSSSCYTLRVLRLNNNGLGIAGGKMLAKALLDCHDNSSKAGVPPLALKVFIAGRNRLENEGAEALASVFKTLTSLEEVVMPQNGIYHVGITALANGLSANPGLRILNLNDNNVGSKGAEALAKALPNFQCLEQLNLGDCLLKTKGALILAKALGVNGHYPMLEEVNLSYNEIYTRGANSIALAMADKKNLRTLQLDGNVFGTDGRATLRNLLTASGRIASLSTLSDDDSEEDESELDETKEEEDEEDEEEEEEEEENADEESESESENKENEEDDDHVHENGNKTPEKVKLVSVVQFLKSPTGENLLLLRDDVVQNFIDHAKDLSKMSETSPELKFIEEFTKIIMKVSALCASGYMDVRLKAQSYTDALYLELCSFAAKTDQISILNNALLVNLGLIKSEDKRNRKIDWDLEGCFKALEQVVQKDYFLKETRTTLKLFLEKPVKNNRTKVMGSFEDSKDSLKAVLNRIQTV